MEIVPKEHVILICAHSNTPAKLTATGACVESAKKVGFDVILLTHCDQDRAWNADYLLFERHDPILTHEQYAEFGITNFVFYEDRDFRFDWTNSVSHDYSVFTLLRQGFRMAKAMGKRFVHVVEYDCIVHAQRFVNEFVDPLGDCDVSCTIWDRSISHLMAAYMFSCRIDAFSDLFESIPSAENYYRPRMHSWQLERVLKDHCIKKGLKCRINDYPDSLMNRNSMFRQSNVFDELRLGVAADGRLFLHIRAKSGGSKINVVYDQFNRVIRVDGHHIIELGQYTRHAAVYIYLQGRAIFHRELNQSAQEFRKLNRLTVKSGRELYGHIDQAFRLGMRQNWEEIDEFGCLIETMGIRHFLEIGTDQGGTFYLLGRLSDPSGIKISVDLPQSSYGVRFDIEKRDAALKSLPGEIHLLTANSHDPATRAAVEAIIGSEKLDLLFIDGDHSFNGVKADFEMYSPLVRDGGLIVFHDITFPAARDGELLNVWEFWHSLEGDKREITSQYPWGGIGVLVKNERMRIAERPAKTSVEIKCHFIDGAFLEVLSAARQRYVVNVANAETNRLVYRTEIESNMHVRAFPKYYFPFRLQVINKDERALVFDYQLKLADKLVFISLESKALGDTIAWFPYVEEFRQKHQCRVVCKTHWNQLFERTYPEIAFVPPGTVVEGCFAMYRISCEDAPEMCPEQHNTIPLQKIASSILGIEHREIRPRIHCNRNLWRPERRYVCIGPESTAQAKFWNYPGGWEELSEWLGCAGYQVVNMSRERDIEMTVGMLSHCEFFVGLSSGLSWVAWALRKPVVMISGFTEPWNEFHGNCVRVASATDLCHGCYNEREVKFDPSDMFWCPRFKGTARQFECSKSITPARVINAIKQAGLCQEIKIDMENHQPTVVG